MSSDSSARPTSPGVATPPVPRRMPALAVLVLSLAVTPACREPPDPDAIADEVEAMCRKDCALMLDCVSEPPFDTFAECLEACAESPGYLAQDGCGTAARAWLRCESELTCDEYSQAWGAPLDAEGFPCVEEKHGFSTCDPDAP